jgi:hypothetical protein
MKSKLALTALSLMLVFTFSVDAKVKGKMAAPKMELASPDHYFGAVKAGTPLTHTFEIKNGGDAPLEIKSVAPGCGCTTSDFDKVIEPGKKGKITLEIKNTEHYKGEVSKTATVTTNDPEHQSFQLILRASFVEDKPAEKPAEKPAQKPAN